MEVEAALPATVLVCVAVVVAVAVLVTVAAAGLGPKDAVKGMGAVFAPPV